MPFSVVDDDAQGDELDVVWEESPADFIRSNFGGVVNFPEGITRVPYLPFA